MQNEYLAHTLIIQYRGPKIRVMLNDGTKPKPIDTIDRPQLGTGILFPSFSCSFHSPTTSIHSFSLSNERSFIQFDHSFNCSFYYRSSTVTFRFFFVNQCTLKTLFAKGNSFQLICEKVFFLRKRVWQTCFQIEGVFFKHIFKLKACFPNTVSN